jgi:hypothetical protein
LGKIFLSCFLRSRSGSLRRSSPPQKKQIEGVENERALVLARMLHEREAREAFLVERDELAVYDRILLKLSEGRADARILF